MDRPRDPLMVRGAAHGVVVLCGAPTEAVSPNSAAMRARTSALEPSTESSILAAKCNPVSQGRSIAPGGAVSDGGGANPAIGYRLLSADSLDAAAALAQGCPHLRYGGSIEVCETMDVM